MGSLRTCAAASLFLAGVARADAGSSTSGHNNVVVPPQTPAGAQQQVIVVPPPPGAAPMRVEAQERPLEVKPCPAPETKVVYRTRSEARSNPLVTVLTGSLLGAAAGAALGAGVGLAHADNDNSTAWQRDIGNGTVAGFAVGTAVGGLVAFLGWQRDRDREHVAVVPVVGPRSAGLALAGRW